MDITVITSPRAAARVPVPEPDLAPGELPPPARAADAEFDYAIEPPRPGEPLPV